MLRAFRPAQRLVLRWRYRRYLNELARRVPAGTGPRILVINHHFDQDIEALTSSCAGAFQFLVVECMPFFNEALLFFRTDADRDGVIPYGEISAETRREYRRVCWRLFAELQDVFPFEIIVMPSDSFWWIREFLAVAAERGVTRVVLDKEGTISPYSFEVHAAQIRDKFPFMSDRLLVWSERQREFWMRTGVPGERISVVGQPRSDFFFSKDRWRSKEALGFEAGRRMVLFFTFDVDAYINLYPADEVERESLTWVPLRNDVHEVLLAFARTHPTVDVVVKVHPQQSDVEVVRRWFQDAGLANVRVMQGADVSNHLIVNADLIVGFQTTALTEALLTDKPVVYVGWGATEPKVRDQLIPFHQCEGLERAGSRERFVGILDDWFDGRPAGGDRTKRRAFTDAYLGADGKACARLREALEGIVRSRAVAR